jgi:hypothetical protein
MKQFFDIRLHSPGFWPFGIGMNTAATADSNFKATTNLADVALNGFDCFPGEAAGQFISFTLTTVILAVSLSLHVG